MITIYDRDINANDYRMIIDRIGKEDIEIEGQWTYKKYFDQYFLLHPEAEEMLEEEFGFDRNIGTRYVFEYYSDKWGLGESFIYDTEEQALRKAESMFDSWTNKKELEMCLVYEVKAADDYDPNSYDTENTLMDYCERIVKDLLEDIYIWWIADDGSYKRRFDTFEELRDFFWNDDIPEFEDCETLQALQDILNLYGMNQHTVYTKKKPRGYFPFV